MNSNFVWFNQNHLENYIKTPNILIISYSEEEIKNNFFFLPKWFENIENIEKIKDLNSLIISSSKFRFLIVMNETFENKFMNK